MAKEQSLPKAWEEINTLKSGKLDKSGGVLTGDTIIKGTGNTLAFEPDNGISTIDFRCTGSNNDRGWLKHYNTTATAKMEFCVSDDPTTGEDFFSFGAATGNMSNINATMTEWVKMDRSGIYHSGREVFHAGNCPISKAQNGYCKLANGLIIQWGNHTNGDGTRTITLPIAFSDNKYTIAHSLNYSDDTGIATTWTNNATITGEKTTTSFRIGTGITTRILGIAWIAIGH